MRQLCFDEARAQELDARADRSEDLARLLWRQGGRELQKSRQVVRQLVWHVEAVCEEELLVVVHLLRLLAEIRALLRRQIKIRVLREVEGPHVEVLVLLRPRLFDEIEEIAEDRRGLSILDLALGLAAIL